MACGSWAAPGRDSFDVTHRAVAGCGAWLSSAHAVPVEASLNGSSVARAVSWTPASAGAVTCDGKRQNKCEVRREYPTEVSSRVSAVDVPGNQGATEQLRYLACSRVGRVGRMRQWREDIW